MSKAILSWNEICRQYPNQAVALTDYTLKNASTISSARVLYSERENNMTPSEIASIAIMSDGKIIAENTSDSLLCTGASVLC